MKTRIALTILLLIIHFTTIINLIALSCSPDVAFRNGLLGSGINVVFALLIGSLWIKPLRRCFDK